MEPAEKQIILILPATPQGAEVVLQSSSANRFDAWFYLGRSATRCAELKKILGSTIRQREIGEDLQRVARQCRQQYIDRIGELATRNDDLFWFLSSLSEKNPYVSQFYLNFCFMETAITLLSESRASFCIFCESEAVAATLEKNCRQIPYLDVTCSTLRFPDSRTGLAYLASALTHKTWFVCRFFCRILYAKLHAALLMGEREKRDPVQVPSVALHSWADSRSFPEPGRYRDIYFGDLGARLEKHGVAVVTILDILPTIWFPRAAAGMRSCIRPWYLLEEFLRFSDILQALLCVRRQRSRPSPGNQLCGRDVSEILREERDRDYSDTRTEQAFLVFCAGRAMGRSLSVIAYVYTFENHLWEKLFITGLRQGCPGANVVGYAHSTVNRMDLSYSLSAQERDYAPVPDIILVNGNRARDNLGKFGFGSVPTEVLGSVRYEELGTRGEEQGPLPPPRKRVLVILSVNFNGTVEMILKCSEAFRDLGDIRVTMKPHPAHSISAISPYMNGVPATFQLSSDPITTLFDGADLVLYTDSTAAVEAAKRGIPLIHLQSDHTIDINIFEDVPGIPSVNSPNQIRVRAQEILGSPCTPQNGVQEMIAELFAPVDDHVLLLGISIPRTTR